MLDYVFPDYYEYDLSSALDCLRCYPSSFNHLKRTEDQISATSFKVSAPGKVETTTMTTSSKINVLQNIQAMTFKTLKTFETRITIRAISEQQFSSTAFFITSHYSQKRLSVSLNAGLKTDLN